MSVKVSLNDKKIDIEEYPKLMIDKEGMIVLFYEICIGTIMQTDLYESIGHFSEGWNMSNFTDYNGEVTLKNE